MSRSSSVDHTRPPSAARAADIVVPEMTVRLGGALLALAVVTAHVADQGGVTAFTSPDWLGWAYRLIEVGGLLTALALLWPRSSRVGWGAGMLLGVAPLLGYLASRTVGVPGDSGDIGNWGDWVGTLSLVVEAGILTLSVGMLWPLLTRSFDTVEARPAEGVGRPDPEFGPADLPHGWDPA